MFVGGFEFPNLSRSTAVYLVEYIIPWLRGTDAGEDIIRHRNPVCYMRITRIDDLKQEVTRE